MTQHHGFPRKVKSTSGSAPGSAPPLPPPNKAHSETSQHHVGGPGPAWSHGRSGPRGDSS